MPFNSKYAYAWEKFSAARRSLMLPHPNGEAHSIADAFHELSLGLRDIQMDDLDAEPRRWVLSLQSLMNTDGIEHRPGVGTWQTKGEMLSVDQRFELSRLVDELACWFRRRTNEEL